MNFTTHEHDCLVIGAGGAGLRAAIEAASRGVSVGLVCKSLLGKAHTVMAEGGMAASLANVDQRDEWTTHFADTMRGGAYLNNWRMAELHAKEAPQRVRELEAWGALFDRTPDGRILQRNFGGHKYPRLAHVGDRTGLEMIRTLQDHGIHQGIDVHMEVTIVTLLQENPGDPNSRVVGAFGYDRERGRFHVFHCKSIVLATGGVGKAFRISSNSWEYTGDGHSLAYHAGADLIDMEFVQFHPTGMVWPPSVQGILVTEGVRGEGGILKNSEGKRFMFDDIPPLYTSSTADNEAEGWRYVTGDKEARRPPELLTRDHVARCIVREVREGRGSPHGGVFLDIAWIKEKLSDGEAHIKRKLPSMYHQFMQLANVNITTDPMEVGPTTHYVMGGVKVDGDTQMSSVKGLFAAGEVAAGLHGANRLGGNSLSDLLVFGKRAGEHAAKFAKDNGETAINDEQVQEWSKLALEPLERQAAATGQGKPKTANTGPNGMASELGGQSSYANNGELSPYSIHHDLQELMQDHVGIVRDEQRMSTAIEHIGEFNKRAAATAVPGNREYNPGWHTALDLRNLLTISEAIARAGLDRKESRGAHFREDYDTKQDDHANHNTVIRRGPDGEMQISRKQIEPMRDDLKKIIEENK